MKFSLLPTAPVCLGYFVAAGLTIAFTRFGDGFATLWLATSYLTALLATRRRRYWLPICLGCGAASVLATGLVGLGWTAAVPLALVNIAEAALAAHLIRRRVAASTMESLNWFGSFLLRIGIVAPATGATFGSLVASFTDGADYLSGWTTWYVGHALGALTFTPLALLVARGEFSGWLRTLHRRWREPALLVTMFVAATLFSFGQSRWPLLFFPLGPLMLICFRHDRALAALSVALLGGIGGILTACDLGPIALASQDVRSSLQFFQFYLASVVITILPVTADLRNRKNLVRALRESDERFRVLLENSTDILLHLQPDGRILYASPSVERLTGRSVSNLLGINAVQLIETEWQDYVRQRHAEVLAACGETVRYEYMAPTQDGSVRWFETISRAIRGERGAVESVISVVRDIDARKADEFNLVLEATCDALTGLGNRRAFAREFEAAYGRTPLSIAMIDIDHFKSINDRFGHAAGDCALQTFAEVARRIVRKDDLISRMGGEEFAVLFRGMSAQQSWNVCERLRQELSEAVTFYADHTIRFTVSVGVTDVFSPDLEHSLGRADSALYDAKRDGRDRLKLAA
jgi:diguanylate cyclase (GGDEF)-like protein/PAS domain S-box-containing protein